MKKRKKKGGDKERKTPIFGLFFYLFVIFISCKKDEKTVQQSCKEFVNAFCTKLDECKLLSGENVSSCKTRGESEIGCDRENPTI